LVTALINTHNKELFERVAHGDEEAFTTLFFHYTKKLFPFLLKKLRSDELAEELLQDIFLKLWIYRERLTGMESPESYLFRITANRVSDYFRGEHKKKQMQFSGALSDEDPADDPLEPMDIREARRILEEGVRALPEQRRKIYNLKQAGYHYREIADQLDISPNTVRNQLVNANRFLLEFLRGRGLGVLLLILSWQRH